MRRSPQPQQHLLLATLFIYLFSSSLLFLAPRVHHHPPIALAISLLRACVLAAPRVHREPRIILKSHPATRQCTKKKRPPCGNYHINLSQLSSSSYLLTIRIRTLYRTHLLLLLQLYTLYEKYSLLVPNYYLNSIISPREAAASPVRPRNNHRHYFMPLSAAALPPVPCFRQQTHQAQPSSSSSSVHQPPSSLLSGQRDRWREQQLDDAEESCGQAKTGRGGGGME